MDDEFNATSNETNYVLINVTNDLPIRYAVPMYGYMLPFLLVITICANTLVVIVLSKRHMSTPTNKVLTAMAMSDLLTLVVPAPWLIYMYTFGNHYKPISSIFICYAWNIMHETIPALFHTASIWLTLALALQRYIYVCHAPVARTWCTMERVSKCIILIYIAATLHQFPRFIDRIYWEKKLDYLNATTCAYEVVSWASHYYFLSYFTFRVIFVHVLPCISLVVLNVLLFRAMRQAQHRREILFRENKSNECRKIRDSNCTTLMLIIVVTVFLIVEIPVAVVTVLHIISNSGFEILDYDVANTLILFTNFFIIVSYPINFAIYCGMSRQFRQTFTELFIKGAVASHRNGSSSRYSLVNGPRTCTNETAL